MKLVLALASLTIAAGILEKCSESKRENEEVTVVEAMTRAYEELETANQNQRHLFMDFMSGSILLDKIRELKESAIPSSLENEGAEIGRGVQSTNDMLDEYIENRNPQLRRKLLKQQEDLKYRIERMNNAMGEILDPYLNASLENATEIQIYLLERLIDLGKRLIAPIPEDSERRITFDQDIKAIQTLMDITKAALKGDNETIEKIRRESGNELLSQDVAEYLETLLSEGIEKESVKKKFSNGLQDLINGIKEIIIALSRPVLLEDLRTWEEWTQETQQ